MRDFTNRSCYIFYQIINLPYKSHSCVIGWVALLDQGIPLLSRYESFPDFVVSNAVHIPKNKHPAYEAVCSVRSESSKNLPSLQRQSARTCAGANKLFSPARPWWWWKI